MTFQLRMLEGARKKELVLTKRPFSLIAENANTQKKNALLKTDIINSSFKKFPKNCLRQQYVTVVLTRTLSRDLSSDFQQLIINYINIYRNIIMSHYYYYYYKLNIIKHNHRY